MFHNALIRVLAVLPDFFPRYNQTPEDIKAKIQSFRSLRRYYNARAVNKAIAKIHVDTVNRWAQQ
jgi:predicted Zn-dependent peptidase